MTSVEVLAGCRVIVELPVADADDLIAAGELLIQEHLDCWTVPYARRDELAALRGEIQALNARITGLDRLLERLEHSFDRHEDRLRLVPQPAAAFACRAGTDLKGGCN